MQERRYTQKQRLERLEKTSNNVVIQFNSESLKRMHETPTVSARKKFEEMLGVSSSERQCKEPA